MRDEILELNEYRGHHSLTFYVEMSQVDDVIEDAEHEPTGYFWESLVDFLIESREFPGDFEFDAEADVLAIYGKEKELTALREELIPYITDANKMRRLLRETDEEGIELDS